MTQGNWSGKRNFNGMGFFPFFILLTFSLFVLNAIVRGSVSRSILMWQQQCKITTSLIVFDVRTSLTLACSFNIKPNCRMACYMMNSFGEIIVSARSVFQNMLLLVILLNVWHISSNEVCGLFFWWVAKMFFHYCFIMGPIPHQMFSQLHLVFCHLNPFLFCECHL